MCQNTMHCHQSNAKCQNRCLSILKETAQFLLKYSHKSVKYIVMLKHITAFGYQFYDGSSRLTEFNKDGQKYYEYFIYLKKISPKHYKTLKM